MSARHEKRDRFRRLAEAQYAWHEANRISDACDLLMCHLLETGHDEKSIAYHTLEHVKVNAQVRMRAADKEMEALAP